MEIYDTSELYKFRGSAMCFFPQASTYEIDLLFQRLIFRFEILKRTPGRIKIALNAQTLTINTYS